MKKKHGTTIFLPFLLFVCLLAAAYLIKYIYRNLHKYLRRQHTRARQRRQLIPHHGRRKARPSPLDLRSLRPTNKHVTRDLEAQRYTSTRTYDNDDDDNDNDNPLEPIARAAGVYQHSHKHPHHHHLTPILLTNLVAKTVSTPTKTPHQQAHRTPESEEESAIDPSLTPFTPARARARRYGAGDIPATHDSHNPVSQTDRSHTHASDTHFTTSESCVAREDQRSRRDRERRANHKADKEDEGRVGERRDEWIGGEEVGDKGVGEGKQRVQEEDEEDELGLDKYFFPDGVGIRRYVSTGAGRGWKVG